MKLKHGLFGLLALLAVAVRLDGAVTNVAPWSESFEPYVNGTWIAETNGWTGQTADAGVVTNLLSVTNYPVSGRTYPVSGTHTNVLAVGAEVVNHVTSVTGGVVKVDFLVLPSWSDTFPAGDTNKQYSVCVSSNGLLSVWHYNRTAGSNEWRELAASPVVSSNDWCRFTIVHDYSNQMFQVAVNEAAPVSDASGWTQAGAGANGPWFYMVKTNRVLSALVAEAAPAYIDDLVVARRSLAWSGTSLTEGVTNNGAVDNSTPITVTLASDTFAGNPGDDLVALGKASVSGVPSNLVPVVEIVNATQVRLMLTSNAAVHEAVNGGALSVQFAGTAFTLGNAWDVLGSQTNVSLAFLDTPSLSYTTNAFHETVTNNGTIDNSTPCLINLAHGSFAGAVDEDFATNSGKLVLSNVPAGLTGEVVYVSATQLRFRLLGAATAHDVANDIGNVTLTFRDGAFNTVPASSVYHAVTNFSISYINPSVLTYGSTTFNETVANNGAVGGTVLTLANKSFNATSGEDMVASGKITVSHLPGGLGVQVVRGVTPQDATLTFSGTASAHAAADSIVNLGLQFTDSAFVGANAAGVSNGNLSNLHVTFIDPRTLVYNRLVFTEISGGAIDNRTPVTITLSGDTLTGANGDDFVAAGKVSVANLPSGLTAQVTRDSGIQLSVRLLGTATANAPGDSVATVSLTFGNSAFQAGNAVYVGNYQQTGISVNFVVDAGFFNVLPYRESFEAYAAGTWLVGTNGWSGGSANAAIITNGALITSDVMAYVAGVHQLPISTTHTQVLYIQDTVQNEVHNESFTNVFVDFMTLPVAVQEEPAGDTNHQYAFYVTTNSGLMVWQQTRTGGPAVNSWILLSNAPAISTSQWARFTVEHDYANGMFQLWVNQGSPVSDPRGWTAGGAAPTGSWFYMVQTNGSLTALKFTGTGSGFVDDFTVLSTQPDTLAPPAGSVFLYR